MGIQQRRPLESFWQRMLWPKQRSARSNRHSRRTAQPPLGQICHRPRRLRKRSRSCSRWSPPSESGTGGANDGTRRGTAAGTTRRDVSGGADSFRETCGRQQICSAAHGKKTEGAALREGGSAGAGRVTRTTPHIWAHPMPSTQRARAGTLEKSMSQVS